MISFRAEKIGIQYLAQCPSSMETDFRETVDVSEFSSLTEPGRSGADIALGREATNAIHAFKSSTAWILNQKSIT
jgi:hypothetical protein